MINKNWGMEEILCEWGYKNPVQIGRGAFARVYRVQECSTGVFCACKVSEKQEMLCREGRLMQQIHHRLFPVFYDFRQKDGVGFLFMEYVQGINLGEFITIQGRMYERQAIRLGIELVEGLCYLHEGSTPIVFRDVKPENIMIREDGKVKLLDLGSAGIMSESSHVITGTPGYAAPEQWSDADRVGFYSDVYAVGRVLEYMLKGEKLHRGVKQLIEDCCRREMEERIPNMRCLLQRLKAYDTERCRDIWRLEAKAYLHRKRKAEYIFQQNVLKL